MCDIIEDLNAPVSYDADLRKVSCEQKSWPNIWR